MCVCLKVSRPVCVCVWKCPPHRGTCVCVLLNHVQLFATTCFHFVHVSNILHPTRAEGVCSGEHSCVCVAQLCPALCNHIFSTHCVCVAQLSPTRCNPMNCSLPSSSVHGTLQARKLEWVAIPFCKGSSWLRDWTVVSCTASKFITAWATGELYHSLYLL